MTFKHIDFYDSATMRSLLKVASEKGLIKEDEEKPIIKEAKSNFDLTPSSSLFENITKLCKGLRDKGFSKYADQLEEKFLSFKIAESKLYKEKDDGEDFMLDAHPEGDVTIAPASNEYGVIETAVKQHKKLVDIVTKEPKGKVSNANKKIVNQVLLALAQGATDADVSPLLDDVKKPAYEAWNQLKIVSDSLNKAKIKKNDDSNFATNPYAGIYNTYLKPLYDAIGEIDLHPGKKYESIETLNKLQELTDLINKMLDSDDAKSLFKDISYYNTLKSYIKYSYNRIFQSKNILSGDLAAAKSQSVMIPAETIAYIIDQFESYIFKNLSGVSLVQDKAEEGSLSDADKTVADDFFKYWFVYRDDLKKASNSFKNFANKGELLNQKFIWNFFGDTQLFKLHDEVKNKTLDSANKLRELLKGDLNDFNKELSVIKKLQ